MNEKTPKKLIKTQKDLEKLILLMKKHRVDCLEIEGQRIVITKHDAPQNIKQPAAFESDDELELWNLRPQ
jgi:hypothetical protein